MSQTYQVIILGGGINGAGIARDLALRGIRCALVEKADLCNGTSAWSSRLIHGGLRYLEFAELDLVRESLREREVLLRDAPHLVRPLPLMIPIYGGAKRGPLMVWAGMIAYDLLSFDKSLACHRMLRPGQVKKLAPGLDSQGLRAAALYYDAQVEYAERLVLELALDAERYGADLFLYHEAIEVGSQGVMVRDSSGQVQRLSAQAVINVTGPWVDQLLQRCPGQYPTQMGGTKGSHIVVEPFPGMAKEALYAEASSDGRPYFIIPWNHQVLIGTTDLRSQEDLDKVQASRQECQYLVEETNRLFPQAGLSLDKISFSYSGVRPLPDTPQGSTAAITRRHQVVEHPGDFPLFSVVGGKLTTYRSLAQEACDQILKRLKLPPTRCRTAGRPLPGATLLQQEPYRSLWAQRHRLSAVTADHLTRTYGRGAEEIVHRVASQAELGQVICERTGALAAEVVYSCQREKVSHLEDFMLRRSLIGWQPGQGRASLDEVLRWMSPCLGWTPSQAGQEKERYLQRLESFRVPLQ